MRRGLWTMSKKDFEIGGHDPFEGSIMAFAWRTWGKLKNLRISSSNQDVSQIQTQSSGFQTLLVWGFLYVNKKVWDSLDYNNVM
jgi:hypothetical protein